MTTTSPRSGLHSRLSGAGDVVTDPDILYAYSRDKAAPDLVPAGLPAALVRPTTPAQVQAAVRAAAASGVAVVPRGAGSGLSGGANATDGCLILSLERMSRILDVDPDAMTATVEPGVVNTALRQAAASVGLYYAPDPASQDYSTLGGNIATNAGGLCCVKYGVTRDALLEVDVVLADGRLRTFGHRTRKGVVGYDLAGLMCGSEGTLGVITGATVRLLPLPGRVHTLVATFPRLVDAGSAVSQLSRTQRPSTLELMDRATVAAVEALAPMELDLEAEAVLFACSDAGAAQAGQDVDAMAEICRRAGASFVAQTADQAEGRMLMTARRLAYPALESLGSTLLDDVAVPLPALSALVQGIRAIAERTDLTIAVFGHAGDGNMHPTIVYDGTSPDAAAQAMVAFELILDLASDLGGTVTGEHGVGLLKVPAARRELHGVLDVMQAVKQAFDPTGLFNPGKGW